MLSFLLGKKIGEQLNCLAGKCYFLRQLNCLISTKGFYHFTFPSAGQKSFLLYNLTNTCYKSSSFQLPYRYIEVSHCGFNFYFSMINVIGHHFLYLFAISISSLIVCFESCPLKKTYLLLSFKSSLYILNISSLLDIYFANIFSKLVSCLSCPFFF